VKGRVLMFASPGQTWIGGAQALLIAFGLWLVSSSAWALAVPPLQGRVNDTAGLLSAAERSALEQRLEAFEQKTRHQFALLTIPTLDGDPIEDFSIRVAEAWKLGDAKQDDGLILLVAVNDRKVRVEVGYGLEGDIPDALAGRVIREVIAPRFRQGQHAEGIAEAFSVLTKAAGGEGTVLPERKARQEKGPSLPGILAGLVVLGLLFFGRGRGGGLLLGAMLGSALSSRGGGGGGGFRGRGGGFGGGGASGGW
jgi:uncharacterized protein